MLTYFILSKVLMQIQSNPLSRCYASTIVFTVAMLFSQLVAYALFVWLPMNIKKGRNACVTAGQTFAKLAIGITLLLNLLFNIAGLWFRYSHNEYKFRGEKMGFTLVDLRALLMKTIYLCCNANMIGDSFLYLGAVTVWMGLLCMRSKDKNAQSKDDTRGEGDALLDAERGECRAAYGADAYADDADANNKVNLV